MKFYLATLIVCCVAFTCTGCGGPNDTKSMPADKSAANREYIDHANEQGEASGDGAAAEAGEMPPADVAPQPPQDEVIMFSQPEPEMVESALPQAGDAQPGVNPSPELEAEAASNGFVLKTVYYGTDRKPNVSQAERWQKFRQLLWQTGFAGIVTILLLGMIRVSRWRKTLATLTIAGLLATYLSARASLLEYNKIKQDDLNNNRVYGTELNLVDGKFQIERGVCFVSIPKKHEQGSGKFERPGLLEFKVDRQSHFDLPEVRLIDDRDKFLSYLRADVQKSPQKQALVFIHGYNVTFELAAMRTAQLAYDLGFDGPAAFFSWPSNGTTSGYASDEETVEMSAPQLNEFLADILKQTGAQSVHVIAHSMGNRALTEMLVDLEHVHNNDGLPVLNQVIMAAPDVNATKFRTKIVDKIQGAARNFTLYASSKDIALLTSEILRGLDYPRLGQGGEDRQVFPGIQTIDASDLPGKTVFSLELGHSYYVNPIVLKDLKYLVETPAPARQRAWLLEQPFVPTGSYWIFDAAAPVIR